MDDRIRPTLLRRCNELAMRSCGRTATNPNVGAVLWDGERNIIIGEGWHRAYGEAHAEVNALRNGAKNGEVAGKSIAVSLEPCNHSGKTPPCTVSIIENQLAGVWIDQIDPNPLMGGKSLEILQNAGIRTLPPLDSPVGQKVLHPFRLGIHQKRPFIRIKIAVSRDGFMGQAGERIKISNAISDRWVHRIRNESQAIMVGTNTVINDNPGLTSRYQNRHHPIRVIPDRRGILDKNLRVFDGEGEVIVCTNSGREDYPANILTVDPYDLKELFHGLYAEYKIGSILVEGGSKLLTSMLQEGLWDEIIVIMNTALDLNTGVTMPNIPTQSADREIKFGSDCIKFYKNLVSR